MIAKTGVDYIDIMPMIDATEETLVRSLVNNGLHSVIAPAVMTGKGFIDHAKACGVKRIILFHAVSDRLMFLRDPELKRSPLFSGKTVDDSIPERVIEGVRDRVVEKIFDNLCYATGADVGLVVDFAAEDASRADFDFLVKCIRKFRPYLGHFMLCDTVGMLSPDNTHRWVHDLLMATDAAPLAIHAHNDLGMALENTIQAVLAGVTMVSGTFGGIGERAGNVALEQVIDALRVRFEVELDGIDCDKMREVTSLLRDIGAVPAPPYSAAARRHETGIHVNSFLRDPQSYSIFPFEEPEIWFGKCSGASNFRYLFEKRLGRILQPPSDFNRMRSKIKDLSIRKKRCFSSEEILTLYEEGFFDERPDGVTHSTRRSVPDDGETNEHSPDLSTSAANTRLQGTTSSRANASTSTGSGAPDHTGPNKDVRPQGNQAN